MPDKIAVGIMAFLTGVLAFLGKIAFVKKSEIYTKSGKPIYQHADNCSLMQQKCTENYRADTNRTCKKIEELKNGQKSLNLSVKEMSNILTRIDQRLVDHEKYHDKI